MRFYDLQEYFHLALRKRDFCFYERVLMVKSAQKHDLLVARSLQELCQIMRDQLGRVGFHRKIFTGNLIPH